MKRFALVMMALAIAATAAVNWTSVNWASVNWVSARPVSQAGNDLLQMLPDGNGVVVIDVRKITASSLWSTSAQKHFKGFADKLLGGIISLGLEPTEIHTIAAAVRVSDFSIVSGIATGAFSQSGLLARLRADQKIKLNSEKYKNAEVYTFTGLALPTSTNRDVSFAFYDANTIVIGSGADVRASIDTRMGERASVAKNAKLNAALAENSTAVIRFAMEVTPAMTGKFKSSDVPLPDLTSINMAFGRADVTSGVDINATLRSDTAEHAKAIADQFNGLLSLARAALGASNDQKASAWVNALKTVTVTGADIDVKITGTLSSEILAQVMR